MMVFNHNNHSIREKLKIEPSLGKVEKTWQIKTANNLTDKRKTVKINMDWIHTKMWCFGVGTILMFFERSLLC